MLNSAIKLPLQDVTVIGAGPAGIAAAISAARKHLAVTLVAERVGGQAKDAKHLENLISIDNTTGTAFATALQTRLNGHDISQRLHFQVQHIDSSEIKTLHLSSGEQIQSKTLIVATGAKWSELGIVGEKENIGRGVAYCPHCDGPFFKGKEVAVVGGGNRALEAALDLASAAKLVTVFASTPAFGADQQLLERSQKQRNVRLLKNVHIEEILAKKGSVVAIKYRREQTAESQVLPVSGVFVQTALRPNSQLVQGLVALSASAEIIIDQHCQTSVPGIFACGDVTTVPYKQIVIAMGEGTKASLAAFDYLIKQ